MRLFTLVLLSFISLQISAQSDSSKVKIDSTKPVTAPTPAYLKTPYIPTFSLQLPDSSWFFSSSLKPNKPVLILYFSPDCGHCQIETEELIAKANSLKDLQIVMVTSRPFEDMITFVQHYKLYKIPSIIVGKDHARRITTFYDVRTTPYSALYDKKGKLVKEYRKGADMAELIRLTNK